MNHLTDLEELVAKIKNQDIRPFISEAIMCYAAGAYRGAIVIATQALFYDLRNKVNALAAINSSARALDKEISRRFAAQEIYESYLSEQLAAMTLIDELDKCILDRIRVHRNKAAHPSGHHPSAEEARYVIYEIVETFLKKPDLYTTQAADWILNGLKSDNYFPTNRIDNIEHVVREGIEHLNPGVFQYLVSKVSDGLLMSSGIENANQSHFLAGLASLSKDKVYIFAAIRKNLIERHVDKTTFFPLIRAAISLNPNLIKPVGDATFLRIKAIISTSVKSQSERQSRGVVGNPITVISNLMNGHGPEFIKDHLIDEVRLLVSCEAFNAEVVRISSSIPEVKSHLLCVITDRIGSSTFDTANLASENIIGVDLEISNKYDECNCLLIILSVIKSARSGAWKSQQLAKSGFSGIPQIREKALQAIDQIDDTRFRSMLNEIDFSSLSLDRGQVKSIYFNK